MASLASSTSSIAGPVIIVACAVHISDDEGALCLQRCLRSIEKADAYSKKFLCGVPPDLLKKIGTHVHLSLSGTYGNELRAQINQLMERMNFYTYPSDKPLSQFQHYERIMQELESDIENRIYPNPDTTFIMFSDGDDIWDEQRLYVANAYIFKAWQKGLVESTDGDDGQPLLAVPHRYWDDSSRSERKLDVSAEEPRTHYSYVFLNAVISAKLVKSDMGSDDITRMLYSETDPELDPKYQQAAYRFPRHGYTEDKGWDAEYWACVVPLRVFQRFFDMLIPTGKGKKDRSLCKVLQHPLCDLAFALFIRDNGFVDMTSVVEIDTKENRLSLPWMYCHINYGRSNGAELSEMCLLQSLSPKQVIRFPQRLADLLRTMDPDATPIPPPEARQKIFLNLPAVNQEEISRKWFESDERMETHRKSFLTLVKEWGVCHILSEDMIKNGYLQAKSLLSSGEA
jgi:hypothetical protein